MFYSTTVAKNASLPIVALDHSFWVASMWKHLQKYSTHPSSRHHPQSVMDAGTDLLSSPPNLGPWIKLSPCHFDPSPCSDKHLEAIPFYRWSINKERVEFPWCHPDPDVQWHDLMNHCLTGVWTGSSVQFWGYNQGYDQGQGKLCWHLIQPCHGSKVE